MHPQPEEQPSTLTNIQVDDELVEDPEDPGYESDDISNLTQSIRSSIYQHRFENGRRYHAYKEGQYFMPNDEAEQDRMDMQHHTIQLVLKQLSFSPMTDPKRVLDLGCGTGLWCIEYADEHPSAEIFGVDLSPIQPSFVPPNVRFQIDDIEDTWTWPENHFDLIMSRLMLAGSIADYEKLFKQVFNHLAPGGYFESHEQCLVLKSDVVEIDDETSQDPLPTWTRLLRQAIVGLNRRLAFDWEDNVRMMERIGFVDVVYQPFKVPLGRWPKDKQLKSAGIAQLVALSEGLESLSLALFTRVLQWSAEETQVFLAKVRNEMKANMRTGYYFPGGVVYGRKPPASTPAPDRE